MEDHKLLRTLVLMGASLVGCDDNEREEGPDGDASAPTEDAHDASRSVDAAHTGDAGVPGDPQGKLCWCPDETCSDGQFAHQGFCCCWGGAPGCAP